MRILTHEHTGRGPGCLALRSLAMSRNFQLRKDPILCGVVGACGMTRDYGLRMPDHCLLLMLMCLLERAVHQSADRFTPLPRLAPPLCSSHFARMKRHSYSRAGLLCRSFI